MMFNVKDFRLNKMLIFKISNRKFKKNKMIRRKKKMINLVKRVENQWDK